MQRSIKLYKYAVAAVFIGITWYSPAQTVNRKIAWLEPLVKRERIDENVYLERKVLQFEGAAYLDPESQLPVYYELINLGDLSTMPEVTFSNIQFDTLPPSQLDEFQGLQGIGEELKYEKHVVYIKKRPYLELYIWPFILQEGHIKRINSFSYKLKPGVGDIKLKGSSYNGHSLLSSGGWYKIKVKDNGIYRLTYDDLRGMGLPNPEKARLFGYGAGMLPELPGNRKYDDLVEIPVMHENDAITFYAEGPISWTYNNDRFYHTLHLYSDYSYYFITTSIDNGKSISNLVSPAESSDQEVTGFDDFWFYEPEYVNLVKSGKEWYGKPMSFNLYEYVSCSFDNIEKAVPLKINVQAAAKAQNATGIVVEINHDSLGLVQISGLGGYVNSVQSNYASLGNRPFSWITNSDTLNFSLQFNKYPYAVEEAWMDYVLVNVRRKLALEGNVLIFRDMQSAGVGNISHFTLDNATSGTLVWDVTDIHNVILLSTSLDGTKLHFNIETDTLRELVAFNNTSSLPKPILTGDDLGLIENQDLHGISEVNYIILTHSRFVGEANELAEFHRDHNDISVEVVRIDQVYNEFSSGTPDIVAIRDFMKYLYDRDQDGFNYLLLFGEGTYDNKTMPPVNPNYVPTYQSSVSLDQSSTFVSDDYYGILDENESISNGKLDIGIGRFPVGDEEEAQVMVSKVKTYCNNDNMGPWRNIITFVGDDEEGNQHMIQADGLATSINTNYPFFNTEKIYLDAYKQVWGAIGATYPGVTEAINNRMKMGALFFNYTGHGGEQGLAHEKILIKQDISNWHNPAIFPIFFTATCEFTRFDDIEITNDRARFTATSSAGEMVVLNPSGGGIASYTTNRLVYGTNNYYLNASFYNVAFEKDENNQSYRLGDLIRLSKQPIGDMNKLKFCLLGDPAIKLPCPKHKILVDSINGIPVTQFGDTIGALSVVTVSGHIETQEGQRLHDFDGVLYSTVFDKPQVRTTLANDGGSKMNFISQDNILFKGRAGIEDGIFSYSFIIPKDINYITGNGKISLYATNKQEDATGYYNHMPIGGVDAHVLPDSIGPDINLYMNDSSFTSGGITNENPKLFAVIHDEKGINTTNSGIGHNISAILDEDLRYPIVLNEYYQTDIDNYKRGTILYPFSSLSEGLHPLSLKVWDVYNNSSEAQIEFYVADVRSLNLSKLVNFPNPVGYEGTAFYFEHNQADEEIKVTLQVFSLGGDLVKMIEYNTIPGGYKEGPVEWDGKDDNGNWLARGIYVYRIILKSADGEVVQKSDKLLILR